ncbi:dsRBD fold-containing protein [Actinomadura chokoriensis]|uniref:DsRBD fold-containing protein n=1 Tax=Actinomadura chokoriensis TaxID=454156 RepID=A0ABV4QYF4_9ACTN
MEAKQWAVDVYITESGDDTHVRTLLTTTAEAGKIEGAGHARRNPRDRQVPEIGDELAVGRALIDLGSRLVRLAGLDIEESATRR